jgi:hypothetical protein
MKTLEVIYSSVCEASVAFLGMLREWTKNKNVNIVSTTYNNISAKQIELYTANGILLNGRMIESCFIDVFYEGVKIDSVPLNKSRIFNILNIESGETPCSKDVMREEILPTEQVRTAILNNNITWIPITQESASEEMTMCLLNYPFGNPPERFHKKCTAEKEKVFNEVWSKEKCAGIYAKYENKVIGLLEVLPREILIKHGFMTGSIGNNSDYLTVGCYEVAFGMPRIEIIDELMRHLERFYCLFTRKMLEGIGVLEWPDGFTPYWVYDKYGFHRQEKIGETKLIMEKQINT